MLSPHRSAACLLAPQVEIFTEEVIRGGSAAALSQLLNKLDPQLRKAADMGRWVAHGQQGSTGRWEGVLDGRDGKRGEGERGVGHGQVVGVA